jgi:fatty-acid desaturase
MTEHVPFRVKFVRLAFCYAKMLWRHGFLFYLLHRFTSQATTPLWILAAASLIWRLFANHGGGHRYFCHQAYECSNWLKMLMALTICTTEIGSLFYWCFLHDVHHSHCDVGQDVHSPYEWGFWNVQLAIYDDDRGAFFKKYVNQDKMKTKYGMDLSFLTPKVTFFVFLAEVIFWLVSAPFFGLYPLELLLWANFLPRVVTIHLMLLTNSAAHMFGTRPYVGNDRPPYGDCLATNCWWVALINGGEGMLYVCVWCILLLLSISGTLCHLNLLSCVRNSIAINAGWHNNHHAFAKSARHGLLWWELDTVYMALCALAKVGVVWDMLVVADDLRLAPRYAADGSALPVESEKLSNKYVTMYEKTGAPGGKKLK